MKIFQVLLGTKFPTQIRLTNSLTNSSINRIFPLPVAKVDDKQTEDEPEGNDVDADGDDDKGDEEKSVRPTTEKTIKSKEIGPDLSSISENNEESSTPITTTTAITTTVTATTSEKKTIQQTYEDILFYVFTSLLNSFFIWCLFIH